MKYLIVITIVVFAAGAVKSQTYSDSLEVYNLDYLIGNAINKNSKLAPVEYQKNIELIKKDQVNKQPAPMLEGMVDFIPLNFMNKPEYNGFYSQRLVLPGKLSANELVSDVRAKKQEINLEQLKIDLIRQVKINYFTLYYYERLLSFNSEYQKIIKDIIKTLEANYSTGKGTQSQILKMNNELQILELEKIELDSKREETINNLKVISNLDLKDDFHTRDLKQIIDSSPGMDSTKLAEIMIKNNPEFKLIDNKVEEAKTEKNIAELEKIPDITLKGGYRYMAKEPMSYIMFSVGIDLTFMPWNTKRINAKIDEKTATVLQANSMRNSSLQYYKNELQSMLIMIKSKRDRLDYLKNVLIPQTGQTFNSTVLSYSSGSGEFMNLLDSYRMMRESDQMQVKEETELLKQYSELEFLLGKQIMKN